jgi:hypothetical protein
MRRDTCVLLPRVGIRMPMLLTTSTLRCADIDRISWKSECARLWYHQSCAEKHTQPGVGARSGRSGHRRQRSRSPTALRCLAPRGTRSSSFSSTAHHIANAAGLPWRSRTRRTRFVVAIDHSTEDVDCSPPMCTARARGS